MGVDRKAGGGIWRIKEKIYIGTSIGSTGPGQKNKDGGRCFRLYNERSTVNGGRRWKVKTSRISFQVIKWDKKKLWNTW